jgi:hypothetical protein
MIKDYVNTEGLYLGGSLDDDAVARLQDALCFLADPQEQQSLVFDFSCMTTRIDISHLFLSVSG